MEAVISIVGSILGSLAEKVVEFTVDPMARQVSYLFKHKSKFQNLRGQHQQLKDARERVQQDVNQANRQGEEIFSYVDKWLTEANGKICEEAAAQLHEDEENAKQRCFVGLCPNFKSRYQLSRKAEKEANAIAQLLKEKEGFDRVSYPPAPEGIATRPVKEYENFESRMGAFDAVMEALKDANLSIIGVYGMGGVGKTTLVKQVARQAREENLFDEVVMAAVTQSFDMKKIQDQIADELGLSFVKQSDSGRAGELLTRLKNKKALVIFDDIWEKFDLEALGIPYGGEQYQGCKILFTSRELNVLSLMGSQKNLAIEILKEEEAWKLFKKVATDIVLSPDLQSTAIEVAKKCAGLPIAIVTVGKAMKNKKYLFEWKNALQELRRPSKRNFKGIPAGVYSAIELSYKFLEAEEHQPTFLLCSTMGHDAAIEDLLKYGMGLGLFHGVNTIEETRYKVSTLVSNLKASSLLLDGSTIDRFDIHDVVHDVAISIAARDHHWLALGRDDVFQELSDKETMRKYSLISLKNAEVSELLDHDQLDCPSLSFFLLDSKDSSLKISNNFFKGMQKLRVLDFANIHFSSLPSSFYFLKNIRTLCLFKCMLKDIVIIGELKNLEILSLTESKIAVLPCEIGQLTKLKLLDLSHCPGLEVIAPDVLPRLSKLEELYLYYSFDGWEVVGHEKPKANASLVELQHLSHLTTLEIHIPDEQALPKELFFEKLERYKISIGESWSRYEKLETSRNLKLKLNNKSIHLYSAGVKKLLRKTDTLVLDAVKDAMDMLYDPNTEGFSHLKHLQVYNVSEIEHIINSMRLGSCKVFPVLESLILKNLIHLKAICYGQLKAEYFGQLRIMKVEKCYMLKNLFSLATARELGQLQEIEVSYCKNLTELIVMKREEDIGDDNILEFNQFHSLKLQELPSLTCLFYSEKKVSSSQQRNVQSIDEKSTVTSLFHQKVVFKGTKELILDSIPIEKLWYDQPTVMSFEVQNLKSLEVYRCHNLKNLFTSSMVKSFEQLKTLVVECCDNIEEVITVTEGLVEDERNKKMIFPKLKYLEFNNLPNLKRFSSGNPIEFPFLMKLKMVECRVLDTFHYDSTSVGTVVENEARRRSISMENLWVEIPKYLFNEKVVFTGIKELILDSISIEKLWHDQLTVTSFGVQNLTSLKVFRCHNLKNLFTSSMVKSFVQLKTLVVECCDNIEEVITVTEGLVEDERNRKMVFPELEYLDLNDLPNLKRFSSENPIEFPFLRALTMVRCPVLDTFLCDSTSVGTTVENEAGKSNILMENLSLDIPKYLFNEKVALPMLERLYVYGLENLERLWSNQIAENSFAKLISFELEECDKLLSVFSLSMVTRLQRLDRLLIRYCDLLEEIFESQEEGSSSATQSLSSRLIQSSLAQEKYITFELPQLTFLALRSLPNLKSFFLKIHTTSWPSLKKMSVKECHKVEIFASENLSFCDIDRMDQQEILIQQPLFWINKSTFPNLEELTLELNGGMKEILHGRLLPRLTELRLIGLQELMHLWKEKEGFQNLRELNVIGCPKLKSNLVPSSVCFQNLMTLQVYSCEGIIKLVTHSTAKSLVQLRKMKICGCQKIEEIIEGSDGDHDEVKDEINFPQLTFLELVMLPKLESFCSSENHTFEFPSLVTVVVEDCPKMKMFSQGGLNAPILHEVRLHGRGDKMDWIWEGSPNSTIQQLLKERNPIEEMQNSIEDQGSSSISSTQPT